MAFDFSTPSEPAVRHYLPTWTTSAPSAVSSSISATIPSASDSGTNLQAVLDKLLNLTGPTSTVTSQQGRSTELEAAIQSLTGQLNTLGTGYTSAYGAKQASYDDVIRAMMSSTRQQGSAQARNTGATALATGLSPVEAQQSSQNVWNSAVQQLFNSLAGLKAEQAGVGVDLQNSLRGVTQDYSGMLSSVLAPYYSAVAGTTQATTDPLAQLQTAYQAASALDQLQQGASQFAVEAALKQAGLDLQRYGIDVGASSQQSQLEQGMQEALLNAQTNRYAIDVGAETALGQQGVTSQGNQLQYGSSIHSSDVAAQNALATAVAQMLSGYSTGGTLAGAATSSYTGNTWDEDWEQHSNVY